MDKFIWKVKVWIGKSFRIALRSFYKFDKWHLFTLQERKYAKDIIQFSNKKIKRGKFAEIGCGLGDIVRNVNYDQIYGFDSDIKVLKAARFINSVFQKKKVFFLLFTFPETKLTSYFDVIIMVNWIHHISKEVLKEEIMNYYRLNLNEDGFIILDTVKSKDYKHNHEINYLSDGLNCNLIKIGEYERQREIWAICK
jgi:2-polyprenyl-3-methyl-5-hydroxy-6-metoxy-1,4-benzoquinol methylase